MIITKYILIAVILLFLAKCGAESATHEINSHPVDKIKIHGKTSSA
jgi:hypothetical protein